MYGMTQSNFVGPVLRVTPLQIAMRNQPVAICANREQRREV